MRFNISLSGSGGQGLILAGVLLAQAAVKDGKNVTLTSSYGPEARGGASRSNLVIDDEPIDFPMPGRLDVLLTMNQESCDTYLPELKDEGMLIVDSSQVIHRPPMRHYSVPFTTIATQIGAAVTANVVALGTIIELIDIIKPSCLEKALAERIREDLLPINIKAMKNGLSMGRKLKKNIDKYYTC
ncbi:2-oxoacid:ferredoxin oxidoreductase, gamma subunit [Candidatus Methanoperedens nitroreducens]|uniref:2-oxoacid:ferredoxin oxidoreductase, gamma subunit n=1 Tax=Candidatus Methanoperedens nitratireducens TaxID=1392998 RepID=A0A062VBX5_9EURY|nr:2-oxoacid:acceptor oxidoreductase family protein [Candidatus Methanoperedens nitroreducens]KCZ73209.1 2-oxoacid:ferredoxin oxidoreductase, gamma subunit [Candidatus Methanoperedens nitroreducens]MDJ1422842.1 2-oxoacid:acceptor oxidoreductase family protein [Candidatus Methanoperedens sp.]